MSEAWVTLATNDTYCIGSLVLGNSLKRVSTRGQLAILITPNVSETMKGRLQQVFDCVQVVDVLDSADATHLALLARPELGITFTKIHAWRLTQYQKCVFLDADTLVIQNCDELFEKEELSAVPDPGWPDCFNSGVFVYRPSDETYKNLIEFSTTRGSFDGGDQGLLNLYFSDWQISDIGKHLSFIYNMNSSASYFYLPAYKQFGNNVKIVHFLGSPKPWNQNFATSGHHRSEHLQLWWTLFFRYVKPNLSVDMEGVVSNRQWLRLSPLYTLAHTPRPLPDIHHPRLDKPDSIADVRQYMVLESEDQNGDLKVPVQRAQVEEPRTRDISEEQLPVKEVEAAEALVEEHHENEDDDVNSQEIKGYASSLSLIETPEEIQPKEEELQPQAVAATGTGLSGRMAWEQGQMDFAGRDSFDNILAKINDTLSKLGRESTSVASEPVTEPKKSE